MTSNISSITASAIKQSPASPCFRLMDLPAELIDLVYHHALASGYTAILRTSHRVYSEAFKILYKSAFLRIYYEGAVSEERWPVTATHVSADTMTLIQNIDICVNFDPNVGKHNTSSGLLASFSGPDAPLRLACNLKLEGFQPTINLDNVSIILRTMSGLVNFQRVYVTAISGKFADTSESIYDVDEGRYYLLKRARNTPAYKLAKTELEGVFGPSIWHDGKKEASRYLEFRPLEYQKSL